MSTPSLSDLLRRELHAALQAEPRVDAVWLGLAPGIPLAQEGRSALALERLAGQAPVLLARPPASPCLVAPGDGTEAVVLPVDEEKTLLALALQGHLDAPRVASLEAVAARLGACFVAWESRLLAGLEEPA